MQGDYQQKLADHCRRQIETLTPLNEKQDLIMDPHQQEAMELAALALAINERTFSIVHSCGSGKTILEANLAIASQRAKQELAMRDSHDVVLTTERSLIHTIRDEFESLGLDPGIWGGGKKVLDRPLIVSSVQAMQMNKKDLSRLLPSERVRLLLGDEADMYLTDKRREIVTRFQHAIKVGLTATAKWPDGRNISEIWGEKIHEMSLREGILNGVNVPPLFYLFEANLDDSRLKVVQGDYDQKELQTALKEAEIQKAVPEVYDALVPKDRRKNFPTLVYVPSVQLAYAVEQELTQKFEGENLSVRCWTGERATSEQIRNDMADFNDGKVDILVLCEMGGRGINLPRARCLIDAYPTLSSTKLEQRHGRVLRQIREQSDISQRGFKKAFALVAQIIPKSNRYRPYLLPDLLDCWPDFKEGRLLGLQNSHGGFHGGDVGSPIQDEVAMIRRHVLGKNPHVHVREVEQVDIYEELKLREDLPQADADGFFELDGERYGTVASWSRELGISDLLIKRETNRLKGITGKNNRGRILKERFYPESIVRERCADLLEELPRADADGFFELDGERYGTASGWARAMGISDFSILKRLDGINGIAGRDSMGRMQINSKFYPESVVRERCADLLEELPRAAADGFFELEGERYGTVAAWVRELGCSRRGLLRKLEDLEGITGKDFQNKTWQKCYYPESIVRERCADLLQELLQTNQDGFFELNGEIYRTAKSWGPELGITAQTIRERLKDVEGIFGKNIIGRPFEFYPESIVRERCADLLQELPQAGEDGFFELDGERRGNIKAWHIELGIAENSISRRVDGLKGITGKDKRGRVWKDSYYPESVVRERCADLLQELPQAGEDGFFELEGNKYGTAASWLRELAVSKREFVKKLKDLKGITGKLSGGQIQRDRFYSESAIKERCADLLNRK